MRVPRCCMGLRRAHLVWPIFLILLVGAALTALLPPAEDQRGLDVLGVLRRATSQKESPALSHRGDGTQGEHKFTVIIQTYNRTDILFQLLNHYQAVPHLQRIIIVWNNIGEQTPLKLWNSLGPHPVPLVFKEQTGNLMRNRLQAFPEIDTDAVLMLDDDTQVSVPDISFAFSVWKQFPDQIVGFVPRKHVSTPGGVFSYGSFELQDPETAGGAEQEWGVAYKITPETTEVEQNVMKCFQINGTKNETVAPQASLPDVQGLQFLRMEYYGGSLCEVWQNVTTVGYKKNTYTLWVTNSEEGVDGKAPATPLHYEMMGYNTLLGSHYDKYLVDYKEFSTHVDPKVFSLPEGMSCGGFPGPGVERHLLANPMKDLIHTSAAGHSQRMFSHFKEKYQRWYSDDREHEIREHAFVHNLRYVHSKNRAGLPFSLALNSLSDRTMSELATMRGRNKGKTPNRGLPFTTKIYEGVKVPDSLDWRLYGAVTPVKDQAICGSCWSFATTGAVEGALFLKTGSLQVLSQQMLVDCSWGFGNNGCDGGEEWRAYEWIMKHGGIATTETYGAYMGMNGFCHMNSSQLTARIQSYTNVTSGDAEALKLALYKNGPVAVSIDAAHRSFVFYSHGVYFEPACGNTTDDLDHAVLAVGYGTLGGAPYWLIKNSWSTYWGNDGYILMSMTDNNCGVTTDATYVTLA